MNVSVSSPSVSKPSRDIVRTLEERDLDGVARLFLTRFRSRRAAGDSRLRANVAAYMRQLYLDGAGLRGDPESQVQINSHGDIGAFVGVIKMTYLLDGEPLTVGVKGSLISSTAPGTGYAAIQLLRELRRRPLDLIVTDSANRTSAAIGRALKYKILSPESLEWAYVFSPAAVLLHKMRQKSPMIPAALLRPLAGLVDAGANGALAKVLKRPTPANWSDETVDADGFHREAPHFLDGFRLRPEWSSAELAWLTTQARQRRSGGPLHFQLVRSPDGAIAGCYAFYGESGGVARVVHMGATARGWEGLLICIVETAKRLGCIGVHGPANESMMPHVYAMPGLFFYFAGGVMAYSNRADVMNAIDQRSAFIGGFAGDRWTRLATDSFSEA